MSKSIKVSEATYQALVGYMKPRESFDDVVKRLLKVYDTIKTVSDILGPSYDRKEGPLVAAQTEKTTH